MAIITTKRPSIKFYTYSIFCLLFLGLLATKYIAISIEQSQKTQPEGNIYIMIAVGILMYFIIFSMVYAYWKYSPKITIENNTISFGEQAFPLADIKEIRLTGKLPFGFLFLTFPIEGATIQFNDGSKKLLFNDMYSNSWEIKSYLEQTVINKQEYKPMLLSKIDKDAVSLETPIIFKGNQFTSLRGLFLWGMIGAIAYILFNKWQSHATLILVALGSIGIVWFVLFSWYLYYFELTNDYLIIRNHVFVWVKKIYRLSDIREVAYETQGKGPNCMRVTTRDFRSKVYPAGTLRNKTWRALRDDLESKGVTVRNECIVEPYKTRTAGRDKRNV